MPSRYRRYGLVVTGLHLMIWLIVRFGGEGTVIHLEPPDWNLFPQGTIWYRAYSIVNAPLDALYSPIDDWARQHFRGGWYDIQLPAREVALNYGFHFLAFLVWWYLLGMGFALLTDPRWRKSMNRAAVFFSLLLLAPRV